MDGRAGSPRRRRGRRRGRRRRRRRPRDPARSQIQALACRSVHEMKPLTRRAARLPAVCPPPRQRLRRAADSDASIRPPNDKNSLAGRACEKTVIIRRQHRRRLLLLLLLLPSTMLAKASKSNRELTARRAPRRAMTSRSGGGSLLARFRRRIFWPLRQYDSENLKSKRRETGKAILCGNGGLPLIPLRRRRSPPTRP